MNLLLFLLTHVSKDVAKHLVKGGEVYLSSDREEIAVEMYSRFRDNPNFEPFVSAVQGVFNQSF